MTNLWNVGRKFSVLSMILKVILVCSASVDVNGSPCVNVSVVKVAWSSVTLRIARPYAGGESVYNISYAFADQEISSNPHFISASSRSRTITDVMVADLQPSTSYIFRLLPSHGLPNCTHSELPKPVLVKTRDVMVGFSNLSVSNVGEHLLSLSVGIGDDLIAQKAKFICVFYRSEGLPLQFQKFSIDSTGLFTLYELKQYALYDVYVAATLASCAEPMVGTVSASVKARTLDHDECEYEALVMCGPYATCTNTLGSYYCTCIEGYVMMGRECLDKNSTRSASEDECEGEEARGVFWLPTKVGSLATRPCPEGSTGEATRFCAGSRKTKEVKWRRPNLGLCVSTRVKNLRSRVKGMRSLTDASTTRILGAAEELSEFFLQNQTIHGGDVNGIVDVLDDLVKLNSAALGKNSSYAMSFVESGLVVSSGLVDRGSHSAWLDLPEQQRLVDADKLLNVTELLAEESAFVAENSSSGELIMSEKNVVMKVRHVRSNDSIEKLTVSNSSAVFLPQALVHDGKSFSLAIIEYRGVSDILGVPGNSSLKVRGSNLTLNSHVLSVSILPAIKSAFADPFVMVHKVDQLAGNGYVPNCVYWDRPTGASGGVWSDHGCRVSSSNVSHVTCECHHLTNFAILMSVTDASRRIEEKHRLALSLITLIGLVISLVALFFALLTFIFVRSIRSMRNTIHQNLAAALFIAELLFLAGIERTDYKIGCMIVGAALHYFFLVAFFVMGLEGIILYLMLVKVYRSTGTTGYGDPRMVIACWVIPIAFVAINIGIDRNAYGNDTYCWLSVQNGFIWSFVGPALFINLVNCVIFVLTMRVMITKAKKRDSASHEIWFWTKGCCLLLSILGATWLVGLFFVDRNTLPLAYVFTVLNSLQGLSIFVFHCLCDPRVRKAYFVFFCRVQPDGSSLFRRSTLSTRTRTSSQSSSLLKKKRASAGLKEPQLQRTNKELHSYTGTASKAADNSLVALVGPNSL